MRVVVRQAAFLVPLLLLAMPALAAPGAPEGWSAGGQPLDDYAFGTALAAGTSGKQAAYIRANANARSNGFGVITQCINPTNYIGQRIRFSGRLKGMEASAVQMYMRVEANKKVVGFYNMDDRPLRGTTDWRREDIVLDIPEGSTIVCYGFMLVGGRGEAWADGLRFEPVGRNIPVSEFTPPKAPVNLGFDR
jgi:hypothetical protein